MRSRPAFVPALSAAILLLLSAPEARAQRGIDAEAWKPSVDTYGILGTERARSAPAWDFGFRSSFVYTERPLHLRLSQPTATGPALRDTPVVDDAQVFHLGAHMGLPAGLEIAFDLPLVRQGLDRTGFGEPYGPSAKPTGFYITAPGSNLGPADVSPGDMRWALKWAPMRRGRLAAGGQVIATLPFGDETAFGGTHSFTVEPEALLELALHRVTLAANLGVRWHDGKDVVYDPNPQPMGLPAQRVVLADADELHAQGAIELALLPQISLAADLLHLEPLAVSAAAPPGTDGAAVTDLRAGVVVRALDFSLAAGGGLGLQDSSRRDDFALFVALAWAPASGGGALGSGDRDGDGIPDDRDLCPNEPEDKDGFEDEDGCPDPDNDHDGIPDDRDLCPNEPEDKDGYKDEDGCPDPDNDGDGIPDIRDQCPDAPEDKDGFQDEDGCPDLDNDGDGIPDDRDKCPNEPETFNGVEDEDGCPDQAGDRVRFQIPEQVLFAAGTARIDAPMGRLLDDIAGRLRRNPQVRLVRLEGHTDNAGNAASQTRISQERADAVREHLVRRGVDPARLQSVGYGARRPAESNATPKGRSRNRRVELIVVE